MALDWDKGFGSSFSALSSCEVGLGCVGADGGIKEGGGDDPYGEEDLTGGFLQHRPITHPASYVSRKSRRGPETGRWIWFEVPRAVDKINKKQETSRVMGYDSIMSMVVVGLAQQVRRGQPCLISRGSQSSNPAQYNPPIRTPDIRISAL